MHVFKQAQPIQIAKLTTNKPGKISGKKNIKHIQGRKIDQTTVRAELKMLENHK